MSKKTIEVDSTMDAAEAGDFVKPGYVKDYVSGIAVKAIPCCFS